MRRNQYPRFEFAGFVLESARLKDLELATAWTEGDTDHRGVITPMFWLMQVMDVNSFLLKDEQGPVFFFRIDRRLDNSIQIYIQFSSAEALREARTRRGLREGMKWLEKMLQDSGFCEYYFHSRNPQLIFWCQKRLGFRWDGVKLSKTLERRKPRFGPPPEGSDEGCEEGREEEQARGQEEEQTRGRDEEQARGVRA